MIAKKLLAWRTRNWLKKPPSKRSSLAYEQVSTIAILFSIEDKAKHQAITRLVSQLEADGKKVEVLCYKPKLVDNLDFRYSFYEDKDLSFWGKLEGEAVAQFLNNTYDYLFFLDKELTMLMEHLLACTKVHCRVGIEPPADKVPFFELMLRSEKTATADLIPEMLHFMKRIG